MALPRSPRGKTDVSIAMPVDIIMAPPIPCSIRKRSKVKIDDDNAHSKEDTVNRIMPYKKIFFLP